LIQVKKHSKKLIAEAPDSGRAFLLRIDDPQQASIMEIQGTDSDRIWQRLEHEDVG